MSYLLAIDQGTTSSRAIVFSSKGELLSQHQIGLTNHSPEAGWVEQDPEEMWRQTLECCRQSIANYHLTPHQIAAIGIANQRETTIIWERATGKPIYPAIVWQDRRTADLCKILSKQHSTTFFQQKTGLLLDPYFSATKILWILENVPHARHRAERGELAFGTVDTFLLWRLTNGRVHATDATNASRTLLFNIHTQTWDDELLKLFSIPEALLPVVLDSGADFGKTEATHFGCEISIASLIGDQQAATVGQTCFKPGMVKSTYGTGCFMLLNTGHHAIESHNKLLTTIAYRLAGKVTFGLEGSIFSGGVIIKWLRDSLKLIATADESERMAGAIPSTEGVYLIPAFTGLGAPYWDPEARAAILGLTRNSKPEHIVRAGLEAVGYQTRDLLEAMVKDSQQALLTLRVDGGMVANNWLLQFLADILSLDIQSPRYKETTALGAAYLAGLQVGLFQSLEEIADLWIANQTFVPKMNSNMQTVLYAGWQAALQKVIN